MYKIIKSQSFYSLPPLSPSALLASPPTCLLKHRLCSPNKARVFQCWSKQTAEHLSVPSPLWRVCFCIAMCLRFSAALPHWLLRGRNPAIYSRWVQPFLAVRQRWDQSTTLHAPFVHKELTWGSLPIRKPPQCVSVTKHLPVGLRQLGRKWFLLSLFPHTW